MKIAFEKHDPSFFAGLIRWWTGSPYSHCEILFDDGMMFSSHLQDRGTRYITPGILSANRWDLLFIPILPSDEEAIRKFCDSQIGCRYDWAGIIFSQIIKLQREHADKWFCSEICVAALQHAGFFDGVKPHTISPGRLYKRLKEAGALPCAQ